MDPFQELASRAEGLLRATSPIYVQRENGRVEGVGTGIFFQHHDRHFVLSAAHVLMHMREEQLLTGDDRLMRLNGRFFRTPNDDVDLAFVPLTAEQFDIVAGAMFLTADNVDASDHPETAPDEHRFYVLGFRADDNAPEGVPNSVVSAGSGYLAQAAPTERYQPLGLSVDTNLVLTFDRNFLYSDAKTVESEDEPQGMSGSGVWQFKPSPVSDRLVAIVTEHSDGQKAIIATRIAPLLDAMALYAAGVIA